MEQVYFTTQERDGTVNAIDRMDGLADCSDIGSIKNLILASANIDRISANRWSAVRYEDRIDIPSFTTIPALLAMQPIPGSLESPLVLVAPENDNKRRRHLFYAPAHTTTVVSELSDNFKRGRVDTADIQGGSIANVLSKEYPSKQSNICLSLPIISDIERPRRVFTTPALIPQVLDEPGGKYMRIPAKLAAIIGDQYPEHGVSIEQTNSDSILYKRSSFVDQFKFLDESVLEGRRRGWVFGPPGTGKSVTAFAFARLKASQGWLVLWIKFNDGYPYQCVRFESDYYCLCNLSGDLTVNDLLPTSAPKQIVFIDGYRHGNMFGDRCVYDCTLWWRKRFPDSPRRLAIISSMAGRKSIMHGPEGPFEAEFYKDSWLQSELVEACAHKELLDAARPYLDSLQNGSHSLEDLIAAKFYFLGGSARHMFCWSTEDIKKFIQDGLSASNHVLDYTRVSLPDRYDHAINRILGSYRSMTGTRFAFVVSQYAAIQLALRAGPEGVRTIKAHLAFYNNPCISGWLFEMLFFSKLAHQGLQLETIDGEIFAWHKAEGPLKSEVPASKDVFNKQDGTWTIPDRWKQLGFQAVFISPKDKMIEFFQVTQGATHALHFSHFADFLKNLDPSLSFEIFVYIVVPLENLQSFKLGAVTGVEIMKALSLSWGLNYHMKIVGMTDT